MVTANFTRDILSDTYALGELLSGKFKGIIHDMPAERYHGYTSFYSSTDLKFITKSSPYHFKVMRETGIGRTKKTDDMKFGSLVHCLLLTPDDFNAEFYLTGNFDRRTKEGKAQHLEALEQAGSKEIVDQLTYDAARECVDGMVKNPQIMELLEPCQREVSYFWKCPFSGLRLRARVDACSADYLCELKTSRSAKPSDFERQAYNMHYDLSACHYSEGLAASGGERPRKVYFIVVENEPPYVSQVYLADDSFMESGHAKWLDAVNRLESCLANDKWMTYSNELLTLSAPRWAGKNVVAEENLE